MSGLPDVALSGLVVALVAMTLLWLVSVRLEDANIAGPFWGPGSSSSHSPIDTGLWRYSRHPNYFGEAVLWLGFSLFAVGAGGYWTVRPANERVRAVAADGEGIGIGFLMTCSEWPIRSWRARLLM